MDSPPPQRRGAWLSITTTADPTAHLRALRWPERSLEWQEARWSPPAADNNGNCVRGCGFEAHDAYAEFSQSEQTLPELVLRPATPQQDGTLVCSCSLLAAADDDKELAQQLLAECVRHFAAAPKHLALASVRVLLVSPCASLPLACPTLAELRVGHEDAGGEMGGPKEVEHGLLLLLRHGMAVMPSALDAPTVAALRQLAAARVSCLEAQLRREGRHGALEAGGLRYAEVCSRGKQRFDMLVLAEGSLSFATDGGAEAEAEAEALLSRVATEAPWSGVVRAALGDECAWQASLVCSRPGAPAGGWHADGGHSRFSFGAEGASSPLPYALCAFVPLVPLAPPRRAADGRVEHGLGCTAFWPGSHAWPACLHLGAAAARAGAVVPGAPLEAGGVLLYDYRTVHAGSPNEGEGERPILQLTYCKKGYRDRFRNYGYEQLFCD